MKWHVEKRCGSIHQIVDASGEVIAELTIHTGNWRNARLMAKAPELLAALKEYTPAKAEALISDVEGMAERSGFKEFER